MRLFKRIVPVIMTMLIITSMVLPVLAYEYNDSEMSGIQIGEEFYSLEYIVNYSGEFETAIQGNYDNIILDINGNSAKLKNFIDSGADDFDIWAVEPKNQVKPNPKIYVDKEGNKLVIGDENQEKEFMVLEIL